MEKIYSPSEKASAFYEAVYGDLPVVEALPAAGSGRRYFRLSHSGRPSVVACVGDDVGENNCFVALSRAFSGEGLNVPEVYAVSPDGLCCLQSDLGDIQLLPLLSSERRIGLAEKSLESLVGLQTVDESVWGDAVVARPFSRRLAMWDLNYFKYEFLKPSGIAFDEERLEDDFSALCDSILDIDRRQWGFMYRDFQSRNVMIRDGEPWMIDFQGGRLGPLAYDAVSFLWQAKAGFSEEERRHLLSVYAGKLAAVRNLDASDVVEAAGRLTLLRLLQVLGAYGFRGLVEKKSHFIESIPAAVANLGALYASGSLDMYPEIKNVAGRLASSRFAGSEHLDGLTVRVFSFSYKRGGYPEDLSGNGGGFMFDCRGMHNPGRYDIYKPLTGLDREVIDFLEGRGEVQRFVDCAIEMVLPSVRRYESRGFRSLQVGFGCTGGRHRSVYCAERFAGIVARECPGVTVIVEHREQGMTRRVDAGNDR